MLETLNAQFVFILAAIALLLGVVYGLQSIIMSLVQFVKILPFVANLAEEKRKWVYPVISFFIGVFAAGAIYAVFWHFTPEMDLVIKIVVGVFFIPTPGLAASGFYDLQKNKTAVSNYALSAEIAADYDEMEVPPG